VRKRKASLDCHKVVVAQIHCCISDVASQSPSASLTSAYQQTIKVHNQTTTTLFPTHNVPPLSLSLSLKLSRNTPKNNKKKTRGILKVIYPY